MGQEVKNIKELKELVKRYESIRLKDIEYASENFLGWEIPEALTGYGSQETCSLCKKVNKDCRKCVQGDETGRMGCVRGKSSPTYDEIENAALHAYTDPKRLVEAFHERARYLSKTYL